jgi:hypothetical protein
MLLEKLIVAQLMVECLGYCLTLNYSSVYMKLCHFSASILIILWRIYSMQELLSQRNSNTRYNIGNYE